MRCVDVIHELERLRGETISGDLAEHLAGCPRCAARAGRSSRLDRLWEATRPDEPPTAAWEAVWARVSEAADAPPAASWRPATPRRPWRHAAIAGLVLAQAAALLVGAALLFPRGGSQPLVTQQVTPPKRVFVQKVDVDYNQTVCIRSDPRGVKVIRVEPEENSSSVDSNFVMLGILEAMAE